MEVGIIEIAAGVVIGNLLTLSMIWGATYEYRTGKTTGLVFLSAVVPIIFLVGALIKNWHSILP
jgi:hypothetical protein